MPAIAGNMPGAPAALAIPLTLRDSLMARLDRFAPVKEIAQIGAAIGREFSYELIAAVAPHARPELDQALAQLTASGLAFQQGTPPDAVYTFKHALVQDAAYDSLLRRRRQELHGKIARVIEERFPDIEATEPELLAHHYTEAKQPEKAIPLWQKAGSLALKRMALAEAIAHLNKGLDLVAALPASAERDGSELDLRTLLGTAWMALKGWPAQEVWDSLHPALELANSLRRNDALVPILWGLCGHVLCRGRVGRVAALGHADDERCRGLRRPGSPDRRALRRGDRLFLARRSDQNPRARGPGIGALQRRAARPSGRHSQPRPENSEFGLAALSTWMLGYPEQAVRISDAAHDHARRRGHPFDLGWALTFGAQVFDYLREPDELLKRAEEADRAGSRKQPALRDGVLGAPCSGIALIRKGQIAEGVALLERGLAVWEQGGGRVWQSLLQIRAGRGHGPTRRSRWCARSDRRGHRASRAAGLGRALVLCRNPPHQGLAALAERRSGRRRSAPIIASLDWARTQQAKSWELRTATSYARLMRDQGRVGEAHDLLAPVYGWFTEGFGTKDLKDAKALLEELDFSLAPLAGRGTG